MSLSVTGLSPNATYHFRLVATSSAGKSEGNDVTFKTPRATPSRISDSVRPHSDHTRSVQIQVRRVDHAAGGREPGVGV